MKSFRTLVVLLALASATAVQALNPQPEPPGREFVLTNGIHAMLVNDHLMLAAKRGKNQPAAAGQYTTRDGMKLVVIKADGQLDAATLKHLKDHAPKPK